MEALLDRLGRVGVSATQPRWSERDVWLIAYPDQFTDGAGSRLAVLGDVLDRWLAPWWNGVHVLPFHPSSSDGGFAVVDYDVVDPAYGDWADVERLADRYRVMADAVVNHTSASHRWFLADRAGVGEGAGWYRRPEGDVSTVTRPRPGSPVADVGGVPIWATFGADQPDLDYRRPDVLLAMLAVVLGYAIRGAAAIRLDAVAYLWKQEGTPSIHLPGTHAVVSLMRSCLDEVAPRTLLVTETNVPHAENVSYLGEGDARGPVEAQAVYQFTLPPLVLHTMTTGDVEPLRRWAGAAGPTPPGTTVLNFLASHDGVGMRPADGWLTDEQVRALGDGCRAAGGVVNDYETADGGRRPYELASTWWSLMAQGVDERTAEARHIAGHAIAFALAGIPLVYVHSVLASDNDTAGHERSGHARDLNRARVPRLAARTPRARRVRMAMIDLLERRRADPAFHPEAPQEVYDPGPGWFGVRRRGLDGGAHGTVEVEVVPPHRVRWSSSRR